MLPEVQCRLFPGQTAFDREDVIDQVCLFSSLFVLFLYNSYFHQYAFLQVFKQRLNALLHNLRNGKYFGDGQIAYMMRVIEYQHRRLPHVHIVFQLTNAPSIDNKIASGQYIDKYVFFSLFSDFENKLCF